MSVLHSPKSGNLISGSGSASEPDLTSPTRNDMFVNQRKRKQPDSDYNVKDELNSFRNEIMSFFREFGNTQKADITDLKQDLIEIKSEIQTLKTATQVLSEKYENIHMELSSIKSENTELKEKVQILESKLQSFNAINTNTNTDVTPVNSPLPAIAAQQDLILEMQERNRRLNNVILVGIPEINEANSTLRKQNDQNLVMKSIKTIYDNCPMPIFTVRIGKYQYGKNRPIKVCFESSNTVKHIFKNKSKLGKDFRIYADQTTSQQNYLKYLKDELLRREKEGESDLTIKYINGNPKIVQKYTKNSTPEAHI